MLKRFDHADISIRPQRRPPLPCYHTPAIARNDMSAPIICPERKVESAWIDYNGHMNTAYYNLVFDQTLDCVFDDLGIGAAYVKAGHGSCFTVETHVSYIAELALHDPIRVTYQLLDWDDKRMHFFGEMYHAKQGYLAATSEQLSLHVDIQTRKAGPFPAAARQKIGALMAAQKGITWPTQVGHVMRIAREKSLR
jgi:acyl-CoA thioester hydrolase